MLILLQTKQRRMSRTTLLYSMTWHQLPRSSVEYSNEILFSEEENGSERGGASRWLISLSQHSHQQLHVASPPQQAHPGAFPVRGSRITPQHDSFLNGDNDFATHEIQKWTRPAGTCNTIQCWTCGWFRTCQQCLSCWRWSRRNSPMSTSSKDCFVNIFGNWHLRFHPNSAKKNHHSKHWLHQKLHQ